MTIHSVLIQKLLSTKAHLGRRVATNHFKIYTYGSRNAMCIIDSDKTLICLRSATDFIANLVRRNGRFLFVNTNPLFDEIVDAMTQKIGIGSSSSQSYWRLGGFLTNSSSPKKFRSRNKKICFSPPQPPDCIVIMDTERKSSVINEASRLHIPIVGLVDSSMPWETYQKITYPVPCNDSVQFVYLFCNLITKTFLFEQKRMNAGKSSSSSSSERRIGDASGEEVKVKGDNRIDDEMKVVPYSA
ncbi:40S ribosomal protein [Ancistrocladus abbreviatus]